MRSFFVTILLCLVGLSAGCQLIVSDTASGTPVPSAIIASEVSTRTVALTETAPVTDGVTDAVSPVITATADLTTTVVATPSNATDLAAQGMAIYRQQYCGICHQLTATGSAGTFGPSHDGVGTLAAQRIADATYSGTATTAAEYLHESLVDPLLYIVPGYELTAHRMPSYTFLPESDLAALVEFLLQQQ